MPGEKREVAKKNFGQRLHRPGPHGTAPQGLLSRLRLAIGLAGKRPRLELTQLAPADEAEGGVALGDGHLREILGEVVEARGGAGGEGAERAHEEARARRRRPDGR